MDSKEQDFQQRLLSTFKVEAAEHVQAMSAGLVELGAGSTSEERRKVTETVFRAAHSLKGAARAVGHSDIESICHSAESVFSALKSGQLELTPSLADVLQDAVDALARLLPRVGTSSAGERTTPVAPLLRRLASAAKGAAAAAAEPAEASRAGAPAKGAAAAAAEPAEASRAGAPGKGAAAAAAEPAEASRAGAPGKGAAAAAAEPAEASRAGVPGKGAAAAAAEPAKASRAGAPGKGAAAAAAEPDDDRSAPAEAGKERAPAPGPFHERSVLADTVRIAAARLDALLLEAEELLSAKAAAAQRASELRDIAGELAVREKSHAVLLSMGNAVHQAQRREAQRGGSEHALVQSRKLTDLTRAEAGARKAFAAKLQALAKSAEQDQRTLGTMVDGLLEDIKQALMLPIASTLEILPRLVRDLARDQRKDIELVVSGAETQIDRRILQEIRDPLLHLVRNSIDHGIETPEARQLAGKVPRGTLSVTVGRKDGKVEIVVSDDGGGIDAGKVREAARKLGIAAVTGDGREDQDVVPLVFRSGLSTSPIITDLSGRGLGLAIVQEKVERLGGTIAVETRTGRGTAFRMMLPVTLATFRGVHVRVNDQHFIVPTAQVEQALRFKKDAIKTVQNRETLYWNAQTVSLVRLADVLELAQAASGVSSEDHFQALVLSSGGTRIAFLVDDIIGEQEVLAKILGKPLSRIRNIAGATVLGSGKPVAILNVADLLRSAVRIASSATATATATQSEDTQPETKSILIVEDSITSRALLKNILESAGYQVVAAVDGAEAFNRLKTERFDLVVSDVEMPRMDGLELTTRIRADKALAEIPVVLVTGLESREHRERGADAGANAYIVKSSFDHSNLLDVVGRLL
jgi:two-component system chemotaxis sensor kinase CheA